jgi:hypothetical protein
LFISGDNDRFAAMFRGGEATRLRRHCEERSDEASEKPRAKSWIASLRSP